MGESNVSKTEAKITIVGLGLVGSSIGLALRQSEVQSTLIGHDKNPGASRQAKKINAIDKTEWNLISACEESDLIILAIPISGIQETLQVIAPYLKPGCTILDTASLKSPVLAWAEELLPPQVHYVGLNPILTAEAGASGGTEKARADLFQNRLFCVVSSAKAEPEVVQMVANLVNLMGGKPLFMDAAEHDGLMSGMDQLPPVLALALLDTATQRPSWRELRKVAGAAFESGTFLTSDDPHAYSELFLMNSDNMVRWINDLISALISIRETISAGEGPILAERFGALIEQRNKWMVDRAKGDWDMDPSANMPPKPNMFVDTFLGGVGRKRQKRDS